MNLKVIHIIGGLGVGGAESALLTLTRACQGTDLDCRVLSLGVDGGMRVRFERAGIPLRCFDFKRRPIRAALEVLQVLRKERPDVVQTWMYHADFIGGLLARLAGCRAILWGIRSIGITPNARSSTRLMQRLCALTSWLIPHRILCVASTSKTAHTGIGYDPRHMVIVPNGYDFATMTPAEGARARLRVQWDIALGHRVVGAVGRYCDEKDYPNLVKAAARIAEKMPNIRFLLVGRGMDVGNSALIEMLGASGHADRFILAGERSDVADCLSAMDLFCLSSRMEAFPNVLVEAMAVGLPCVSTDVGDAAKIMGGHGVLVPKEDDARLAEGLSALLACSDAELASLGAMARAHVTLEFSIQKTLASVRGLYSEMLGREKS